MFFSGTMLSNKIDAHNFIIMVNCDFLIALHLLYKAKMLGSTTCCRFSIIFNHVLSLKYIALIENTLKSTSAWYDNNNLY